MSFSMDDEEELSNRIKDETPTVLSEKKKCIVCNVVKEIVEFGKIGRGHRKLCIECEAILVKEKVTSKESTEEEGPDPAEEEVPDLVVKGGLGFTANVESGTYVLKQTARDPEDNVDYLYTIKLEEHEVVALVNWLKNFIVFVNE